MDVRNVAQAIQCAHYWKFRRPITFYAAVHEGNEIIAGGSFPQYLDQWLDYLKGKDYENHPVIRFLRTLRCDRERGR